MKPSDYRAIHTAIVAVYGKPTMCELCKGEKFAKRLEWSNKDHKYSLERKKWWMLCSKCHREWDARTFGKIAWNKGNRKERPVMICEWCGIPFPQKRVGQIFCSTKCTGHRNGNILKRK